jgi:hypothetical protein
MPEEIPPLLLQPVLEPFLVRHADAQKLLGLGASAYYKLIREHKLTVVGRGRMGRCYYPSIRDYVARMLAEATVGKAA